MNKTFILFIMSLLMLSTYAQSPYQLNWKKEAVILGGGAAIYAGTTFVSHEETSMSVDDLAKLNPDDVNAFDRSATKNYSESAAKISDVAVYSSIAGGLVSAMVIPKTKMKNQWTQEAGKLAILWFETNLVNNSMTELTKISVKRIRPLAYNTNAPLSERQNFEIRKSFFSGHTSNASSNMFFIAKVFSDYYPDSKWKPAVWSLAAAVPAFTGYMRYRAGRHFPTDIITGYVVGAGIGYLIPELHKVKRMNDNARISVFPYRNFHGSGAILTLIF